MEKKSSNSANIDVPNPEVSALPKRRIFTADYKKAILEEVEACTKTGGVGEIIRREGLYSSHLTEWRRERDRGVLSALGKKRGRKTSINPLNNEVEKLRRDNAELKRRLEQAELIIDVQKKVSSMLGILKSPVLGESA
jgi:transposase-like protein